MYRSTALQRAFQRFTALHPRWSASLFDHHFLDRYAQPLLQQRIEHGTPVQAVDLANLYITQFYWPGPILALSLECLIEVSADFLRLLDEELGPPVAKAGRNTMLTPQAQLDEIGHVLSVYAEALRDDSNRALDWLWLAAKLPSPTDRRYCLDRARRIDPHSPLVQRALSQLENPDEAATGITHWALPTV